MEKELIQRARDGDEAAFADLMRLHQDAAFRLAYLMLGERQSAHDVTQTAFIRAYDALSDFDVSRPLRPYLLRIVANLAKNRRRSIGRYWAAVKRFAIHNDPKEPAQTVESLVLERTRSHALWQAVKKLKPHEQEIIYLRFFLDITVSEAAETLEIAEGTVKSRTSRALSQLKGVILRDYPELAPYEIAEVTKE